MKQVLTPDQVADLVMIQEICDELGADLVVIGATSLLLSIGDLGRFTRDVDLTVALDLDEFAQLADRLTATGWQRAPKLEHRWVAPRQTIVDLLPAGPSLRRSGSILWPASQFTMSLAGFDHVFASAVEMHLAEGLRIRVVPAVVTVLLKIIAYMEDPRRRSKDLQDIRVVLARYEAQSDRLFSDAVFDAELPDFEVASAFLLGLDLRALATNDDAKYVKNFLDHFLRQEDDGYFDDDDFSTKAFRSQIRALNRGFESDRSGF
jgi:predicted nucleotidyltransferase